MIDFIKFGVALGLFVAVALGGLYWYVQGQTATVVYACSEITDKDPADVQRICKYALRWSK